MWVIRAQQQPNLVKLFSLVLAVYTGLFPSVVDA